MSARAIYEDRPTPDELEAVLGQHWAICAKTPYNVKRYGKCITPAAYRRACEEALRRRDALERKREDQARRPISPWPAIGTKARRPAPRLDRHAILEAAKLLEERAVTERFVLEQPGGQAGLAKWIKKRWRGGERLRDRVTHLSHIEEMSRRLRRMLRGKRG